MDGGHTVIVIGQKQTIKPPLVKVSVKNIMKLMFYLQGFATLNLPELIFKLILKVMINCYSTLIKIGPATLFL